MKLIKEDTVKITGSSLKGYVTTDYATLVNIFGEPTIKNGNEKTTTEWHLVFVDEYESEILATIYDWKTDTTPTSTYEWHIGGFSSSAPYAVEDYMKASGGES